MRYFSKQQGFTEESVHDLCKSCWFFLYDSFRISLCILYPPQWIALSAMEMTFRHEKAMARKNGKLSICFIFYVYVLSVFFGPPNEV